MNSKRPTLRHIIIKLSCGSTYQNQASYCTILIDHMIISIDEEKAFDVSQHPFMIQHHNFEGLKAYPQSRMWQVCLLLPLLLNIVLEVLARATRQQKEKKKRHLNWRGRGAWLAQWVECVTLDLGLWVWALCSMQRLLRNKILKKNKNKLERKK